MSGVVRCPPLSEPSRKFSAGRKGILDFAPATVDGA